MINQSFGKKGKTQETKEEASINKRSSFKTNFAQKKKASSIIDIYLFKA
jgi:hypothetical protein